jgi:hypothetical protein
MFSVVATHPQSIPALSYVLVGNDECKYWVLGELEGFRRIKKVSVVRMPNDEERDRVQKFTTVSMVCLL